MADSKTMKMANAQQSVFQKKDHSTLTCDIQQAVVNLCKFSTYDRILISASAWRPQGQQGPTTPHCFNNWFQRTPCSAQCKNGKPALQDRKENYHTLWNHRWITSFTLEHIKIFFIELARFKPVTCR